MTRPPQHPPPKEGPRKGPLPVPDPKPDREREQDDIERHRRSTQRRPRTSPDREERTR